jgi:cellulose synthase/poly-beta-1,6-N-acetylglucosamine synthase-like glycosyltransferase
MGWGAHSLSEDLEFSARALMRGVKTQWAHDAVVYDEKPLKFMQSWRQRKRWAQGHWDVAGNYIWPLFRKGVREKKWTSIDIAIQLCQPHMVLVGAGSLVVMVLDYLMGNEVSVTVVTHALPPYFWWVVIGLMLFAFPALSFFRDKLPWRSYVGLLPWCYPVFMYAWIPILVAGFVHRDRREWSHTEHSRSLSYGELVQEESA